MRGCLNVISFLLLIGIISVVLLYAFNRWTSIEKSVIVVMRSSNEDCDEFKCLWKIESVLQGDLGKTESCFYLLNSKKEYAKRDSVERILVRGIYTSRDGQAFYADCIGTRIFIDRQLTRLKSQH